MTKTTRRMAFRAAVIFTAMLGYAIALRLYFGTG